MCDKWRDGNGRERPFYTLSYHPHLLKNIETVDCCKELTPTPSQCWGSVRYTKSVLSFSPVHEVHVEVRSGTRRPFWALVLCTKSLLRFGPDASHHHFHRLNNCAVTCFTTCYVLFDHLNDQKVPLTSSWGIIKSYYRKIP